MTPGLLTDDGVRTALRDELLDIEPFADESLQPASYDLRVGRQAFVSGEDALADVESKGLVVIEAGEFAVIQTRERVRCGPQVAGQIGLTSTYARMGLVLLSGPQIDPGFEGVLVVRVTNLAPKRITLAYEAPFLTAQFLKLAHPVARPYSGWRQGQVGIQPQDLREIDSAGSPTVGGLVKALTSVAKDVAALSGDVSGLSHDVAALSREVRTLTVQVRFLLWLVPVLVAVVGLR